MNIFQDFLNWTGANNTSGNQYGFWSGFGSDLGEITLIGMGIAWYRNHTCHVDTCHKFGKHQVEGTPYKVCRKHHPSIPKHLTHLHIVKAHKEANQ